MGHRSTILLAVAVAGAAWVIRYQFGTDSFEVHTPAVLVDVRSQGHIADTDDGIADGDGVPDQQHNPPGTSSSSRGESAHDHRLRFPGCEDKHSDCEAWGASGECEANPAFMLMNCAVQCRNCEAALEPYEARCKRLHGHHRLKFALLPGDITRMFARAANLSTYGAKLVHADPPVLYFEQLLSEAEADELAERGRRAGYERSTDTGAVKADGTFKRIVSTQRTSENSWCNQQPCVSDQLVLDIQSRLAEVSGVPVENHEFLQMLRYHPGQYYVPHHDFIRDQVPMPCGPRVLTFFLYLSDVEEGGETTFTKLKDKDGKILSIVPKKGAALLWPNVRDDEVGEVDPRTHHEANTVKRGLKLAANAWIHLHNFREPNKFSCTG